MAAAESLTDQVDALSTAWRDAHPTPQNFVDVGWPTKVWPDHILLRISDDWFSVPYTKDAQGNITFDEANAVKVDQTYVPASDQTPLADEFSMRFEITKVDDDQHLVFGWAKLSKEAGAVDLLVDRQGDSISIDELEKAAYDFSLHSREADDMHVGPPVATLVESMVFTPEKLERFAHKDGDVTKAADPVALQVLQGTLHEGWWTGWKVHDDGVWADIKKGDRPMLSIHGWNGARED